MKNLQKFQRTAEECELIEGSTRWLVLQTLMSISSNIIVLFAAENIVNVEVNASTHPQVTPIAQQENYTKLKSKYVE